MLAAAALPVPSREAVRVAAEHALPLQAEKIEAVLARAANGGPPQSPEPGSDPEAAQGSIRNQFVTPRSL